MKLLPSVRASALQRPRIIASAHCHTPVTCHYLSAVRNVSQLSPPSSSSPPLYCSQSKRAISTRKCLLSNFSPPPKPSLSREVRLLMRRVPHPVAIITTSATSTTATAPIPRGMTVSSFNTVTLHPKPVISFNVHHPSETLLALQSSARFLVHLLAPGTAAARLARAFAKGNENLELGGFEWEDYDALPRLRRKRRRQEEDHTDGSEGEEEVDFSFVLECQYLPDKTVQVYDHMIVLGTVERVVHASPRSSTNVDTSSSIKGNHDFCLTYADTRFWKMGEGID